MARTPEKEESEHHSQFLQLAARLFYPLTKLMLRYGITYPQAIELLEAMTLAAALEDEEFSVTSQRTHQPSLSHAALLTDISRHRISQRYEKMKENRDSESKHLPQLVRILTDWRVLPRYRDTDGRPCDLPLNGPAPSLQDLVKRQGPNLPLRAVADMLVRNGNAIWLTPPDTTHRDKRIRWQHSTLSADLFSGDDMILLGQIGSDFMDTYEKAFNPLATPQPRLREAYFGDIDENFRDEALEKLHDAIQAFNSECIDILKTYRSPTAERKVRIGVGSYSFIDAPLIESLDTESKT